MLRRLSVFAGAFRLQSAKLVCSSAGVAAEKISDLLEALADKSLVMAESAGGPVSHYRLLETIKAFAAEQLERAGSRRRFARPTPVTT